MAEARPVEGDAGHDREVLPLPLHAELAEPGHALLHHVPLEAIGAGPAGERDADRHGHGCGRRDARGKPAAGAVPDHRCAAVVVDVVAERECARRPGPRAVIRNDDGDLERRSDGRLLRRRRRAIARNEPARDGEALAEGLRPEALEPRDTFTHQIDDERVRARGRRRGVADRELLARADRHVAAERDARAVPDQRVAVPIEKVVAEVDRVRTARAPRLVARVRHGHLHRLRLAEVRGRERRAVVPGRVGDRRDGREEAHRRASKGPEPRDALAHEIERERARARGRGRDHGRVHRRGRAGIDARDERRAPAIPDDRIAAQHVVPVVAHGHRAHAGGGERRPLRRAHVRDWHAQLIGAARDERGQSDRAEPREIRRLRGDRVRVARRDPADAFLDERDPEEVRAGRARSGHGELDHALLRRRDVPAERRACAVPDDGRARRVVPVIAQVDEAGRRRFPRLRAGVGEHHRDDERVARGNRARGRGRVGRDERLRWHGERGAAGEQHHERDKRRYDVPQTHPSLFPQRSVVRWATGWCSRPARSRGAAGPRPERGWRAGTYRSHLW